MNLTQEESAKIIQFLEHLGISSDKVEVTEQDDELRITVNVPDTEAGIYIGRFASTIDSIQLLLALMLNSYTSSRRVTLDIGGYRARRTAALQSMVERVKTEVLETGLARALPPISATERRQVHLMLSSDDKFTTYSQGEGRDRRLFIALRA